jgi:hypothetical protein
MAGATERVTDAQGAGRHFGGAREHRRVLLVFGERQRADYNAGFVKICFQFNLCA